MINRRKVRETVLQAIYALRLSNDSTQKVADSIIKKADFTDDKELRRFAEKLFFETIDHKEEFDEIITKHIKNWDLKRLALVDQIVLSTALCEFLYFELIPTKVTINEAIEIVKRYSTAKSGRFVNGILDAALNDLDKQGRINKKGRGLIQQTISS